MADSLSLLGVVGSLRKASYNRSLMRAAGEVVPEGVTLTTFERLGEIPLYDGDVEDAGFPEAVVAFKDAIAKADGLLIATPEYNYGVPGVLKNAIDWASRPPGKSPLLRKPVGIMGATPGGGGTIRSQMQIRQSFVFLQMPALLQPEMMVSRAQERFDESGKLTDDRAREQLKKYLAALCDFVRKAGGAAG